ncbi:MAG: DivIVA domain-containing protein [Armatimonadota bacterium]
MKITPIDLMNKKFDRSMRGYSVAEVEGFLHEVADELGKLLDENKELRDKAAAAESEAQRYRDIEGTLNNALVLAQKTADDLLANAHTEADLIIRESREKVERDLEQARRELEELRRTRELFNFEFKALLRGYLEVCEKDVDSGDRA